MTVTECNDWRTASVLQANKSYTEDLAKMFAADSREQNAIWRDPLKLFMDSFRNIASSFICEPVHVRDAGVCLGEELLGTGSWDLKYVTSPSLGFPRPYMSFGPSIHDSCSFLGMPGILYDTMKSCTGEEGMCVETDMSKSLATICMLLDRPAYSDELIPEVKSLLKRDPKEPFWGTARAAKAQADIIAAIGLMYVPQLDAYWIRATQPFFDAGYEIAWATMPRIRSALEIEKTIRQQVTERLPAHPFIQALVNMTSKCKLSTNWGEKDALLLPDIAESVRKIDSNCAAGKSTLAQMVAVYAMADAQHLVETASLPENSGRWASDLLTTVIGPDLDQSVLNKFIPKSGSPRADVITPGMILESLQKYERLVMQWPELGGKLGWSYGVKEELTEIESTGADFILSDGDYYSSNPVSVLAGLRPCISMGNKRLLGFPIRFDDDWNTGLYVGNGRIPSSLMKVSEISGPPDTEGNPTTIRQTGTTEHTRIQWSTLSVRGWMANSIGFAAFQRYYIPSGMSMGEQNAEARWNPSDGSCIDQIAEAVNDVYNQFATEYVRYGYGDPVDAYSKVSGDIAVYVTDWDVWAIHTGSTNPKEAQNQLTNAYGDRNVDVRVDYFLYRSEGWNQRVPVQMAIGNTFEIYDEYGNLTKADVKYAGYVMFDDVVDIPKSSADLNAYVDLLRVTPPELPDVNSGEPPPPETST
jgi:hypothetical protein